VRSMLAWPAAAALAAVGLALYASSPRVRPPAAIPAATDPACALPDASDPPLADRAVFAQDFDVSWAAFLARRPEPTVSAQEQPVVALALDASPLAADLTATASRSVPEPSTLGLVTLGTLALCDRRRPARFSFARA